MSKELKLYEIGKLTFAKPDTETFPLLKTAFDMLKLGGAMPSVLNAANEVAVEAFLKQKICFGEISESVIAVTQKLESFANVDSLEDILNADKEARIVAYELIN